ncbi:hypothetical protein D3C86_2144480 [compost metagenome]
MVLAVDRLAREIAQRVVHEAHVPLEAETKPAFMHRRRDLRPGGAFLSDCHHTRMRAVGE